MQWLKARLETAWFLILARTSLVAQVVKCLPTVQETQLQSLGQKDLLEKEMATHSSILAWKIAGENHHGGAWWAAIYGVAQSRTRPKRLSSSSSSTH